MRNITLIILLILSASNAGARNNVFLEKSGKAYTEKVCIADETIHGVFCQAIVGQDTIRSTSYPKVSGHRSGDLLTFRYFGLKDMPVMIHTYRISKDGWSMETRLELQSATEISSNHMAPFCTDSPFCRFAGEESGRALVVPYDNDDFVHYKSVPVPGEGLTFEAGAFFDGLSRKGFIAGSILHDTWKTGIAFKTSENGIEHIRCFGGVTHRMTRDKRAHGSISGTSLESPLLFIGVCDDWRRGLERLGERIAASEPPRRWNGATPFGWNSWAAMERNVNYAGVISVSDYIGKSLKGKGFDNGGTMFIGLDSFWSNLSETELKAFVDHCHENGQEAGIYWCPFSDWGGNGNQEVEGTHGRWKYSDLYLRADGKPLKIESLAVDPTHEGTRMRMEHYIGMFKRLGFRYLKLDFINNGALEADSYYDKKVHTGTQAYNNGMKYLCELCGDDMFLTLSIAPVFPAGYGNARRISCDTWGAMSERPWGSTGYMLNSLSFGWWLDRVYQYNDPDHILFYKPDEADMFQEGANRARITSAVITGIVMLGDNLSDCGHIPGSPEARMRAELSATNRDILALAQGRSFYPMEGWKAESPDKAERVYVQTFDGYTVVAVFNFDTAECRRERIAFSRIGILHEIGSVQELWTGSAVPHDKDGFTAEIPARDVRVYRVE